MSEIKWYLFFSVWLNILSVHPCCCKWRDLVLLHGCLIFSCVYVWGTCGVCVVHTLYSNIRFLKAWVYYSLAVGLVQNVLALWIFFFFLMFKNINVFNGRWATSRYVQRTRKLNPRNFREFHLHGYIEGKITIMCMFPPTNTERSSSWVEWRNIREYNRAGVPQSVNFLTMKIWVLSWMQ